jgi:hypothetical protein
MSTSSVALPDALPRARSRAVASAVPWYVWTAVLAVASGVIGAHWDISWHRTIGRDTFWSPPHFAIYAKGVLAGLTFGYLILHTTFARRDAPDVIAIWGLRGPLGAFIAAWGGIMMLWSGPFDDWWHQAYGLDVKIVSPPHVILILGSYAVTLGAIVLVQALRARVPEGDDVRRRALRLPLLILGSVSLIEVLILQMEYVFPLHQHSAMFYRALSISIPAVLCAFWITTGHRWACTIVTGTYTAFMLTMLWVLPLFPAEPKLGPVYQHVTHFIPNGFPLLLIVPAIVMDLVLRRIAHRNRWLIALVAGPLFLLVFMAVQWPFADFLQSPGARNAIFGSHYFSYAQPPTSYGATYRFYPHEASTGQFLRILGMAFLFAPLSARVGLGVGQWLLRIKR